MSTRALLTGSIHLSTPSQASEVQSFSISHFCGKIPTQYKERNPCNKSAQRSVLEMRNFELQI